MADITTPTIPMIMGGGGGDGMFGGGNGGGLIGGLVLGSLLRQGNGGLFGGGNEGGGISASNINTENAIAASERLTNARFDALAQANIEASIERTNAANLLAISTGNSALGILTAKGQGETNTQNALLSAQLGVQVQKTTGDLATQVALSGTVLGVQIERLADSVNKDILESKYTLSLQAANNLNATQAAIKADGDQTRAILISQNDTNLNRMLVNAQNEIIELRGDSRLNERTRGIEVTTTNNINQMQQQQQQQAQYAQLSNLIWTLGQNITNANSAINVGSGTQTSIPTNTNTNIR